MRVISRKNLLSPVKSLYEPGFHPYIDWRSEANCFMSDSVTREIRFMPSSTPSFDACH